MAAQPSRMVIREPLGGRFIGELAVMRFKVAYHLGRPGRTRNEAGFGTVDYFARFTVVVRLLAGYDSPRLDNIGRAIASSSSGFADGQDR